VWLLVFGTAFVAISSLYEWESVALWSLTGWLTVVLTGW